MSAKNSDTWGLDKRIVNGLVVAVIVSLAASTLHSVVWATRTDTRLEALEKRVENLDNIHVVIAVIQENQGFNRKALERIERRLEKRDR